MSKKKNSEDIEKQEEETLREPQAPETPEETAEADPAEDTLQNELAAERDKFLRLAAEYDNFRKRSQKERLNLHKEATADAVIQFLPVYDNMERALSHETKDEAFYKGVEMIMTGFKSALENLGVTEIPAVGETFDPERHNAVLHIEDPEKGQGEIVEELQKGFKMGDKVIRFSMVKVAN